MFVLCYAGLWEACFSSILMCGLVQRDASQGDHGLVTEAEDEAVQLVQSAVSGSQSALTQTTCVSALYTS